MKPDPLFEGHGTITQAIGWLEWMRSVIRQRGLEWIPPQFEFGADNDGLVTFRFIGKWDLLAWPDDWLVRRMPVGPSAKNDEGAMVELYRRWLAERSEK